MSASVGVVRFDGQRDPLVEYKKESFDLFQDIQTCTTAHSDGQCLTLPQKNALAAVFDETSVSELFDGENQS